MSSLILEVFINYFYMNKFAIKYEKKPIKLICEHIVFTNKVSIIDFAKNCKLSKQTVYRALAGHDVSHQSNRKILSYFCYLQIKETSIKRQKISS